MISNAAIFTGESLSDRNHPNWLVFILWVDVPVFGIDNAKVFTARRSYASAVLGVVILSVRLSVRLFVTRVLCD